MPPSPPLRPVTLGGKWVSLEPLTLRHAAELEGPASEPELWKHMGMDAHRPELLAKWVEGRVNDQATGTALPFLLRDARTRQAIGSSSLFEYNAVHHRIEIGHTWVGKTHRGTKVNPEAKLLLLDHAFTKLQAFRVQLRTDPRNLRSRSAILKIGAKEEGILRNYSVYYDGTTHDRVMYSITHTEWPAVSIQLQSLIAMSPASPGSA